MGNDITEELDGKRPFEERIFARFDGLDNRLLKIEGQMYGLGGRVQDLEARGYDTKPIWENALKEILEGRREVKEFKREVTKRLDQIQAVQLSKSRRHSRDRGPAGETRINSRISISFQAT